MIKVFVTGAGATLGQGIIKALRTSSLPFEIVAADPGPLAPGLYWADKAYLIPGAGDPGYMHRLCQILDEEQPELVLIGTDVELPIFASHRHALERDFRTHVLVSSPEVISVADDKYLTFQYLEQAGLSPPLSALPEDAEALDRLIEAVGFPLVVKPRVGARSAGVSVVHTVQELRDALSGRTGLLVQECVGNEHNEYTASVLVFDGRAAASIVMRRDLRDGNTYRAFTEPFEALNRFVLGLGTCLNPYGPANFQFRTDAEGHPRVFEINARFSGTTPLRALAGFNEVEMCARALVMKEPILQPEVQPVTIVRHLSETVIRPLDRERLR